MIIKNIKKLLVSWLFLFFTAASGANSFTINQVIEMGLSRNEPLITGLKWDVTRTVYKINIPIFTQYYNNTTGLMASEQSFRDLFDNNSQFIKLPEDEYVYTLVNPSYSPTQETVINFFLQEIERLRPKKPLSAAHPNETISAAHPDETESAIPAEVIDDPPVRHATMHLSDIILTCLNDIRNFDETGLIWLEEGQLFIINFETFLTYFKAKTGSCTKGTSLKNRMTESKTGFGHVKGKQHPLGKVYSHACCKEGYDITSEALDAYKRENHNSDHKSKSKKRRRHDAKRPLDG